MSVAEITAHKSCWGYHPCSYDLFVKIKKLHKLFTEERTKFYRMCRDLRKARRNRTGNWTEPSRVFCRRYHENWQDTHVVHNQGWAGETWQMKMPPCPKHPYGYWKTFPARLMGHTLPFLYRNARIPSREPVIPFSDERIMGIEELYARAFGPTITD